MAALDTIKVNCPVCKGELPDIPVVARTLRVSDSEVQVNLEADLTDEWWAEMRREHADCTVSV